jgi:hypothetical protein
MLLNPKPAKGSIMGKIGGTNEGILCQLLKWSVLGLFCGANHSTFHVKNTPHLYVTNGVRLTFLLKNSYKFHFLTKNYEKIKIFLYSYLSTSQKYSIIDTQNIP